MDGHTIFIGVFLVVVGGCRNEGTIQARATTGTKTNSCINVIIKINMQFVHAGFFL